MPPRGKESIIRRQKEIARQQKQKEKVARREEKRTHGGKGPSSSKDEISPDDLVTLDELIGPRGDGETAVATTESADDGTQGPTGPSGT